MCRHPGAILNSNHEAMRRSGQAVNPGQPRQRVLPGKQLIFLMCYNTGRKSATWTLAQKREKRTTLSSPELPISVGWAVGGEGTSLSKAGCLTVGLCSGQTGRKGPYSLLCSIFSSSVFETGVCYIAQAGLEPMTLLLQSPDCWDYRCMPTCLDCCCVI